jgi:hypothetical protein
VKGIIPWLLKLVVDASIREEVSSHRHVENEMELNFKIVKI